MAPAEQVPNRDSKKKIYFLHKKILELLLFPIYLQFTLYINNNNNINNFLFFSLQYMSL